jgi:hypothetical protein
MSSRGRGRHGKGRFQGRSTSTGILRKKTKNIKNSIND